MDRITRLSLLCSLPMLLNACASIPGFQASQSSEDKEILWKEQVEQRLDAVADHNAEIAKLRARVSLLETENRREFTHAQNEFAAINSQMELLKKELEALQSSRSKAKAKAAKNTQKNTAAKAFETNAESKPLPEPVATQPAPQQNERAKAAYYDAFFAMKNGDYFEASLAFRNFLRDFPDDKLAGEAKYWYAESLLAQGEPMKALAVFQEINKGKPFTPKHAAALLQAGLIHEQQQQHEEAATLYSQLIRQHPSSSEAETARSKLKQ
ncbi:tol-pal system protein YbgF [Mariprofundus ferrinatatus]|uniref:Tol-pal system protein YbgF n=1 Tax=Mariprofundus ferrinatatus TaxID=1921087 RepID=A0A2K8L6G1_9PROT|nr:tol-pal system protein YbgF [Mariprofundus ferrinatatus]ATX82908.1 tol-pal system protein YbgF [Mariprofundus ferrinatatus]